MRRADRAVKDITEIEEIILKCKTCHVAMAYDDIPYVVPLSFGYKFLNGGILELYFHSAPEGKKIDMIKKNSRVCFEMSNKGELIRADTPCAFGYSYSSLIGYGEAVFIEDEDKKREALCAIYKRQTGEDAVISAEMTVNTIVFKIISSDFMGKRLCPP